MIMISNATNALQKSRKESLLGCAGCTSICVWLVCDLVVMCVQAVSDRAIGDLCVCVQCVSVQSQIVRVCYNRVRHRCGCFSKRTDSKLVGFDVFFSWLLVNSKCARLECMRVLFVTGKHQYQILREEYDISQSEL